MMAKRGVLTRPWERRQVWERDLGAPASRRQVGEEGLLNTPPGRQRSQDLCTIRRRSAKRWATRCRNKFQTSRQPAARRRLPLQRSTVRFQNQGKDQRDEDGETRQDSGSQKPSALLPEA